MRHDHVRPYGRWPDSFTPTARDLREFDARACRSIDGARGGTYTPATPLAIGGAGGLDLTTPGSALADIETRDGGRIEFATGYPRFRAPRTRTLLFPLGPSRYPSSEYLIHAESADGALGYSIRTHQMFVPLPRRYIHHGATLQEARLRFRVTTLHAALPTKGPSFGIIYQRSDMQPVPDPPYLLAPVAAGAFPLPATKDAYYNDGAPQTIVTTDVVATHVFDVGNYQYSLILNDEEPSKPSPKTMVHSLALTFNVSDLRAA